MNSLKFQKTLKTPKILAANINEVFCVVQRYTVVRHLICNVNFKEHNRGHTEQPTDHKYL